MWTYVGDRRTSKRLQRAKHRVDMLRAGNHEFLRNYTVTATCLTTQLALVPI